jgi:hypothetical protein
LSYLAGELLLTGPDNNNNNNNNNNNIALLALKKKKVVSKIPVKSTQLTAQLQTRTRSPDLITSNSKIDKKKKNIKKKQELKTA